MSHYTLVKSEITDIDCLVKALKHMGFKDHMIEVSPAVAMPLKGYRGDVRGQRAHVRIKGSGWGHSQNYVGGLSNDLGWEFCADGSTNFHVSDYDVRKYNKKWQAQLLQHYGVEKVRALAEENQFSEVLEETTEEQQIHLRFESIF